MMQIPSTSLPLSVCLLALFGLVVYDDNTSFFVAAANIEVGHIDDSNKTNHVLCTTDEIRNQHPVLCHMLDKLMNDPSGLCEEITQWALQHNLLVGYSNDWEWNDKNRVVVAEDENQVATSILRNLRKGYLLQDLSSSSSPETSSLPVVFAHGMGDSCYNGGMQRIVNYTSATLGGVYTTCIPIGKNQQEDTSNGYFMNMDASVNLFAEAVSKNPKLQQGFHAIGFSQGNNVIRGYIARYNEPTVDTFLSINGVNGGVGAVPYCIPDLTQTKSISTVQEPKERFPTVSLPSICDLLMEQASKRAYTEFAQQHSFQANYWRDPRLSEKVAYETYSQLASWNNEGLTKNSTYNKNYAKTTKFVWVLATEDGMVWPKEGEQWGAANSDVDDPFSSPILTMNETEWYKQDLFGLRTAQEQGKNYFESFHGDHLQFTMGDFTKWIQAYLG